MKYESLQKQMHERAQFIREKGMKITADLLDKGANELLFTQARAAGWWAEFVRVSYQCCPVCGGDAKQLRETFMRDTFWPESK
jgi:hypothetical protein